jgi:tripartite ATP-independent transporter DctM subunit
LKPGALLDRVEGGLFLLALAAATLLPLLDAVGRPLGGLHVPGSAEWVRQATLFMAFLGALLAARATQHLTLSTAELLGSGRARRLARLFSNSVAASVTAVLARASVDLVRVSRQEGKLLPGGVPEWIVTMVMPLGLALLALHFAWAASDGPAGRLFALATVAAAFGLGLVPQLAAHVVIPLALVIILAALVGAPVFVAMGGIALLLFFRDGTPVSAVPAEIYRLVASPTLPAIPLLTAAGYVLAEGKASVRLVRFFRALFGWMPGAIAVVTVLACTFFTTFTGASGVTIVALGGLLLPALLEEGYTDRFSVGLLTSSGALGLLFPPCLPVILYGVMAGIAVDRMFLGGFLPGLLLVLLTLALALRAGFRVGRPRPRFSPAELGGAFLAAKWEILLPVLVIVGVFGGFATIVETAAFAVLYVLVVGTVVHRDISLRGDFPRIGAEAATLIGGVLIILAAAMGLTSYMVDAGVPAEILSWVRGTIHSRVVFLIVLNVFLLLVGALMDVFSAIIVVVPIIAPMAAAFGIDPVHLGIIFLANLQLGYLTPPVGMNLFLAAYRFKRPLGEVVASIIPFLLILLAGVLAITYVPWLTTALLR